MTVNATDDDLLQENNVVHYHLLNPVKGFSINSETGVITANRTALLRPLPKEIELIIVARDSGKPALSSTCTVIVRLSGLRNASSNREFKINVNENAARGTSLLKLADLGLLDGTIVSQEGSDVFETSRGRLIISKNLDREFKDRLVDYLIILLLIYLPIKLIGIS